MNRNHNPRYLMANLSGFDASTMAPMADFSAMPVQKKVMAMMVASEMKPTKAGTGSYLECKFQIVSDGPFKGRNVWARLNLSNPNKQAEDIAQRELGAICKAVGIMKPNDSADLHNRPLLIDIDVEKGEGGKDGNKISAYHAVGAGVAPATTVMSGVGMTGGVPPPPVTAPWARPQ